MPAPLFALVLVVGVVIALAATGSFWLTCVAAGGIIVANRIIRVIRKNRYFASESFQALKAQVSRVVREHNDVVEYVGEIRSQGSFELGSSSTGRHAHLATFENTSAWKYRRDRNIAEYAPHVHNASLQVVRNASAEPLKYLLKYFSIKADQETLADVQRVANDISRLEEAIANVGLREAAISATVKPPVFILQHFREEFWSQIGVHLSPIKVPYPQYKFQYTSAAGNSGQQSVITLDTPTLEALSALLADKIRWSKSAAGQRA